MSYIDKNMSEFDLQSLIIDRMIARNVQGKPDLEWSDLFMQDEAFDILESSNYMTFNDEIRQIFDPLLSEIVI